MAAKATPYKYLKGSVVQGSADAFVQGSVSTGLSGEEKKALRVKSLVIRRPSMVADAANLQIAFSRKSLSAFPVLSDRHVCFMHEETVELTTSGAWIQPVTLRWRFAEDDFLIVEDPIYFVVDSASTSAANTVYYELACEECTINENDRWEMLVSALGT